MTERAICQTTGEVLDRGPERFFEDLPGRPLSMFYVLSFFESEDGRTRWMPTRGLYRDTTRSLRLTEAGMTEDFAHAPEAKTGYTGPVEYGLREGMWGVWEPDGHGLLTCQGTSLTWSEPDVLEVSGESVGPACRMSIEHPDAPMVYTSRPFQAAGEVKGHRVKGTLLHASVHLPTGKTLIPGPYVDELQIAWVEFITELEDGSFENGLLIHGRDGFAVMVVARGDEPPLVVTDPTVDVENDGGDPEFVRRIRFSGGGETLVYEALARGGRWPLRHDMNGEYRLSQGTVRRDGSTPVRRSYALLEAYQDRI